MEPLISSFEDMDNRKNRFSIVTCCQSILFQLWYQKATAILLGRLRKVVYEWAPMSGLWRQALTFSQSSLRSARTINTSLASNSVEPPGRIYAPFLLIITMKMDFGKFKSTILLFTAWRPGMISNS